VNFRIIYMLQIFKVLTVLSCLVNIKTSCWRLERQVNLC